MFSIDKKMYFFLVSSITLIASKTFLVETVDKNEIPNIYNNDDDGSKNVGFEAGTDYADNNIKNGSDFKAEKKEKKTIKGKKPIEIKENEKEDNKKNTSGEVSKIRNNTEGSDNEDLTISGSEADFALASDWMDHLGTPSL